MFQRTNSLVFYSGILILFSIAALACSSSDGEEKPFEDSALLEGVETNLELASTEFNDVLEIPSIYTCYGLDVSPPVSWSGVPEGTRSLALIVDEPDRRHRVHWVLYDLPPDATDLPGRTSFTDEKVLGAGKQGRNDFGRMGWAGPCPEPGGKNEAFYAFNLYALDTVLRLDIEEGAKRNDVLRAMEGHVVGHGRLTGKFCRTDAASPGGSGSSQTRGRGSCPPIAETSSD